MDNGVEFQNSTYNDWQIFSIIGRVDVATSALVEEAATTALDAAIKIRGGYVSNELHFERRLEILIAPEQES